MRYSRRRGGESSPLGLRVFSLLYVQLWETADVKHTSFGMLHCRLGPRGTVQQRTKTGWPKQNIQNISPSIVHAFRSLHMNSVSTLSVSRRKPSNIHHAYAVKPLRSDSYPSYPSSEREFRHRRKIHQMATQKYEVDSQSALAQTTQHQLFIPSPRPFRKVEKFPTIVPRQADEALMHSSSSSPG